MRHGLKDSPLDRWRGLVLSEANSMTAGETGGFLPGANYSGGSCYLLRSYWLGAALCTIYTIHRKRMGALGARTAVYSA